MKKYKEHLKNHASSYEFSRAFIDCDSRSNAAADESYHTHTNNSGARDMSPHVCLLTPGPKIWIRWTIFVADSKHDKILKHDLERSILLKMKFCPKMAYCSGKPIRKLKTVQICRFSCVVLGAAQVPDPPQNLGKCFVGYFKASKNFKDDLERSILLKMQFCLKTLIFRGKPTRKP